MLEIFQMGESSDMKRVRKAIEPLRSTERKGQKKKNLRTNCLWTEGSTSSAKIRCQILSWLPEFNASNHAAKVNLRLGYLRRLERTAHETLSHCDGIGRNLHFAAGGLLAIGAGIRTVPGSLEMAV